MSVPSALPTLPPLATVLRLASVTEISTGKFRRFDEPETLVWSMVIDFRFVHVPPVLYHPDPPPPAPTVQEPACTQPVSLLARSCASRYQFFAPEYPVANVTAMFTYKSFPLAVTDDAP